MDLLEKVKRIVASVLDCNVDSLNEESGLLVTFNWDSLNHITIIVGIEEHFNIKIPDECIIELTNIKSIVTYIDKEIYHA